MPYASFLNGRAPVKLRGLQFLALSDVGSVRVRTYTSDVGGGASQVWAAESEIPCRIDPLAQRAGSQMEGGRIDERSTHIVSAPAGTDVIKEDRFYITGRGMFEVTAVRQVSAEWLREFEVIQIT